MSCTMMHIDRRWPPPTIMETNPITQALVQLNPLIIDHDIEEIIPTITLKDPELHTKRYFIPCSKSSPTHDCGINVAELVKTLNQSESYFLLEDQAMSPNINKSNSTPPAVRQTAWSQIITHHSTRCLLGILTNRGALDIYEQWRDTSSQGLSISDIWYDHCSSRWGEYENVPKDILIELKYRSHEIKFTAFTWGRCVSLGIYDLFVGTLDGTVTIWRIFQDLNTRQIDALLFGNQQSNKEHVTCMTYYYFENGKYILFLSYINGMIRSFTLGYTTDGVLIGEINELWTEEDKMEVRPGGLLCVKLIHGSDSELVLYAIKGNLVLILYVDNGGKLISVGKKPIYTNDLLITGFVQKSESEFLIATNSGNLHLLVNKHKEASISKIEDSLIKSNYSCYGFCLSKCSAIAVVATSVRCNYDHLSVRDLGHMVWYSLHELSELHEIVSANKGPLSEISDVLEVLRIDSIFSNNTVPCKFSSEEIDKMEITDLKNVLVILQLSILIDTIQKKDCSEKKAMETEIKDMIISCHVFKTLLYLINGEKLHELNKQSLMLMKNWLNYLLDTYRMNYQHTSTTAATIQEQLVKFDLNEEEECSICGGEMTIFPSSEIGECCRGHMMPRCSLSFLQCADLPYYICKRCNMIANFDAVTDSNNCCLFCDNVFKLTEQCLRKEEINPTSVQGDSKGSEI